MVVWLLGAALATGHDAAAAAPRTALGPPGGRQHIDVIQLTGLIDPIEADFVGRAVTSATRSGAVALIVQLDSGGGVTSQARVDTLAAAISRSPVPVAVWIGPNGARAYGAAFSIFRAAALKGMAPGTRVGDALPPGSLPPGSLPPGSLPPDAPAPGPRPTGSAPPVSLSHVTLSDREALAQGVATISAPTLGDFLVSLDGRSTASGGRDQVLHTADVIHVGGQLRRQPSVDTLFEKLSLPAELLHTVASPSAAYLLVLIGLALIVLEFFTAGIGIAAFCGAGSLILASYGFGVLPFRGYALALVVVAVLGFAIDVQAGTPRTWTVIGTAALVVATARLYRGAQVSPLVMGVGVIGTVAFMIGAMPSMVRARFSTPTIGRQSMIGEMGTALATIEPEGTVEVRGAPWRARTNRATPIARGASVRVVAIDGLLLEVEPELGGARDARH